MSFFCKNQEINFQSVIPFSYDFCLDRLLEKRSGVNTKEEI